MQLCFKPKQIILFGVSAKLSLVALWRNVFCVCVCVHKVLDGSESQYSGMQIGTLQDEEDEGAAPASQEEPQEPFLQSALGMFVCRAQALLTDACIMLNAFCVCVQL